MESYYPRRRPNSAGDSSKYSRHEHGLGKKGGEGLGDHQAAWRSPAVLQLAQQCGPRSGVQPMVVEAPRGTILAAVGEPRDNAIAGDVLQHVQASRAAAASPGASGSSGVTREHKLGPPPPPASKPYLGPMNKTVFGAVYEHTWNGRPVYVADTDQLPERVIAADQKTHRDVRRTMALAGPDGGARVVWAGVGRGPVGETEMRAIRNAIVEDRSARQRVQKLSGVKPYSRHG